MRVAKLLLQNFRNFEKKEIDFHPKLTMIFGPNASGKSNICEALLLLSSGRSFRARNEVEMIRFGSVFSHLELNNSEEKRGIDLRKRDDNIEKKLLINGVSKRLSEFAQGFYAILFGPWVIDFLFDSPYQRRYHIDTLLIQTNNKYYSNLFAYNKVLTSRNKLLEKVREKRAGVDELSFWDQKLVSHGQFLHDAREDFFDHLGKTSESFSFKYIKSAISEELLSKKRQEEINFGHSLIGPHRDDFKIFHEDRDLLLYGSRGEQRLSVLALAQGEISFIEKEKNVRPLLILDDVFSELDDKSQKSILFILEKGQTLVTSTHTDMMSFMPQGNKIININGET